MRLQTRHLSSLLFFFITAAVVCGPAAAYQAGSAKAPSSVPASDAPTLYKQAMQSIEGDEGEYPAKVLGGIAVLTTLSEQGYAPAQFKLGYFFHTGDLSYDCLKQVPEKAYYWYGKAAEQNHLKAQYELGMLYNPETGFERFANREKYVFWISKAADLGFAEAQVHLGTMYETGDTVKADPVMARQWYEKAARQGNKRAIGKLKKMPQ